MVYKEDKLIKIGPHLAAVTENNPDEESDVSDEEEAFIYIYVYYFLVNFHKEGL